MLQYQAIILIMKQANISQVSKETGISRKTLYRMMQEPLTVSLKHWLTLEMYSTGQLVNEVDTTPAIQYMSDKGHGDSFIATELNIDLEKVKAVTKTKECQEYIDQCETCKDKPATVTTCKGVRLCDRCEAKRRIRIATTLNNRQYANLLTELFNSDDLE